MWKVQAGTKHIEQCKRVFKNYDPACPRCLELKNGSKPRAGYNGTQRQADAIRIRAIAQHNCKQSNCMSVCVAFDW